MPFCDKYLRRSMRPSQIHIILRAGDSLQNNCDSLISNVASHIANRFGSVKFATLLIAVANRFFKGNIPKNYAGELSPSKNVKSFESFLKPLFFLNNISQPLFHLPITLTLLNLGKNPISLPLLLHP